MKFFNKNLMIKEEWVGERIFIYNGKEFQKKMVNPGMVGHKLGEFVLTKRLGSQIHIKVGKKKKDKGRK